MRGGDNPGCPPVRDARGPGGAGGRCWAAAGRQLRNRGLGTLRDRWRRVRTSGGLAMQAGLAAALSWLIAQDVLASPQPVFALISAVGTLAASVGQGLRRTIELIIGVAVGVLVGDALIYLVGTGAWQLALVVVLAILAVISFGGSAAVVMQAAATAVLIVTLSPSVRHLEVPRFVDALVGGGVALLVTTLLLPLNPLRVINRAARPALDLLASQLDATASALTHGDAEGARRARDELRQSKDELHALTEAMQAAREATTLSPLHWRRRGGTFQQYAEAAEPIDRSMRNSGTLIRRAATLIEDNERVPEAMPRAVDGLAESVRRLRHELAAGKEPIAAREQALRAVCEAGRAYRHGVGFSGRVVVAQVRTTVSDLLVATGLTQEDANRLVRVAFGEQRPRRGNGRTSGEL